MEEKVILSPGEFVTEVNDGIKLIQNRNGLVFGTDALMLAAFVRRMPYSAAAEFGSGSGIVSLLLASRGKLGKIYAVENQEYYAGLTERNVKFNGLSEKIETVCSDARDFSSVCDVIFTNPPYMKTGCGRRNTDDGKYCARHEVNGDISDFCRSASGNLKYGGFFYCVYRPDRAADLICAMRESGIEPKRIAFVFPDPFHKPCLMLAEGKKGGKPACDILKPLYLKGIGGDTRQADYIYANVDWPPDGLI